MAEKELIEKIAREHIATPVLRKDCKCGKWRWGRSAICPDCTARNILALIKEANPQEINPLWVKLAEDQNPPQINGWFPEWYNITELEEAGWRKVELGE